MVIHASSKSVLVFYSKSKEIGLSGIESRKER